MQLSRSRPRPAILTTIGVLSLVWSIVSPLGVGLAFIVFGVLMTGTRSEIPALVQLIAVGWFFVSPMFSIVLFVAGFIMLNDNPITLKLHRYWAWIRLVIDVPILGASGMFGWPFPLFLPTGIALIDLIYAGWLLHATGLPDVRAYFVDECLGYTNPGKCEPWDNDLV